MDESAALSGLVNVICVVTAEGVAAADASDATVVDADTRDKFGVENTLPIAPKEPSVAEEAVAAALKAVEAAEAAASPIVPGGNVS
jgi:hypothetical protein